jgi:hypothetical protein
LFEREVRESDSTHERAKQKVNKKATFFREEDEEYISKISVAMKLVMNVKT